ncbi:MAG: xanthine dehydrogenase family protein molybdopterin-binding subunit, partial [Anaerolineales bacterium]
MTAGRVVGHPYLRKDAHSKVTGEYRYGMDWALPGMLHGAVVRSTHPHARILDIDVREAKNMPGVEAVLIGSELPALLLPGVVWDQPPLARELVRYVGEPIALVAASRLEIAQAAVRSFRILLDPLPVVDDPEAAMELGAPLVHEDWSSYKASDGLVRHGNICCHSTLKLGDLQEGFAASDLVVEESFTTVSVHQAHLEPRVAIGALEA